MLFFSIFSRSVRKVEIPLDQKFFDIIEANPVIAAVKDDYGLEKCCAFDDIKMVFVLYGDVCSIDRIVEQLKASGKTTIVHVDLVNGLSGKEIAVDFIRKATKADGIISTKPALVKRAGELGLFSILRLFMLDSMAFENAQKQIALARPDVIEILPGLMPSVISAVARITRVPVIAGGMISCKEHVVAALTAGAISVSTTNSKIWEV